MEIPFFELEFNKKADLVDHHQLLELKDKLATGGYTDILVFSHGWNNDMNEARALYSGLLSLITENLQNQEQKNRFLAVGVLWPSKKFAEKELIAGGAAGTGASVNDDLIAQCAALKTVIDSAIAEKHLEKIISALEDEDNADYLSQQFTGLINAIVSDKSAGMAEDAIDHINEERIKEFITDSRFLKDDPIPEGSGGIVPVGDGDAEGVETNAASLFSDLKNGIQNLLNLTTYYQMKERSGLVGRKALNPILHALRTISPAVKLHLIGHSFGARLVTSSILGPADRNTIQVNSLTLLQAAFSHYAFAERYDNVSDGIFRKIILDGLVNGPILITHTRRDKAVGLAYALASRLARQTGQNLGGPGDLYGGLGGNGAQKTPGKIDGTLLGAHQAYQFLPGNVYNLKSDEYIGGHSDILKPEVAKLVIAAFEN